VPLFHRLTIESLVRDTEDSLVVTFAVPDDLRSDYQWLPGQHVTLRMPGVEPEVRRTYSICAAPGSPMRVGIKRLDGGLFSSWAATTMSVGDEMDVMTPSGSFTIDCDVSAARHVVAIAAGSGITPVRAIVEAVLTVERQSRVTLVFVNRAAFDAMFLHELAELKDRFIRRFALWHVLTREGRDLDLLSGHVDAGRAEELVARRVIPIDADAYYLCGPEGFIDEVRSVLEAHQVHAGRTRVELFTPPSSTTAPRARSEPSAEDSVASTATIVLEGRATTVYVTTGESVLDAALRVRGEVPYSCRSGVCSTCRALLRDGTVEMATSAGLEDAELAAGYVLTCQAIPTSDRVVIDFDS
jgi:ring-1,2-phenylacetyl-CoA epoxidase subunit PaaE